MNVRVQAGTFSLPILWARLYTIGLPVEERQVRLAQIASDVHDHRLAAEADGTPGSHRSRSSSVWLWESRPT